MTAVLPLQGRRVVVTRPARQAALLADLISRDGGQAILFPVIEILDIEDRAALNAIIDNLEAYGLAIFVSPNAVDKGLEAIHARRRLPPALRVAAIGRGSARTLRKCGVSAVIAPEAGADSESLLALPELSNIAGQRIVIFRGVGGRELLRDTLAARGARVDYAECYLRTKPAGDTAALTQGWARGEIDALVVTSSEGLRNLHAMLRATDREHLARTPLFVPHPRIAETARELGLEKAIVTQTGDEGLVAGLAMYFVAK
ncbi:MAG TPA: uroporphyrinogen-III synthase [Burkholderiales bacterium]|nr:uroporphyrinogen-III synthase [Burkholderiales bacterium]